MCRLEKSPYYPQRDMVLSNLNTIVEGINISITPEDVLYVPNMVHNLFSSSRARRKGLKTVIDDFEEDPSLVKFS